jgi:hypothetical protein
MGEQVQFLSLPNKGTGKVNLVGNRLNLSLYQVRKQVRSGFYKMRETT